MRSEQNKNTMSFIRALIKKQKWSLEKLSGEIICANSAVKKIKKIITELEEDIANQAYKLRLNQEQGKSIVLEEMDRIKIYIRYKTTYLEQTIVDQRKAEEIVSQLTEEYGIQKHRLKVMQNMLNERKAELLMNEERDSILEMDDLWAQREYAS